MMKKFTNIDSDLQRLLDKAEREDWSYDVWKEEDGRTYVELSQYSPLGEDFSMCIDFDEDNQAETFMNDLYDYYVDFDANEHAKMWIESIGKVNGVPYDIVALVKDAKEIEAMIDDLHDTLYNYEILNEKEDLIKELREAQDAGKVELYDVLVENFSNEDKFDLWIVEHIFEIWELEENDKTQIEDMFYEFVGIDFITFLKNCKANIKEM